MHSSLKRKKSRAANAERAQLRGYRFEIVGFRDYLPDGPSLDFSIGDLQVQVRQLGRSLLGEAYSRCILIGRTSSSSALR